MEPSKRIHDPEYEARLREESRSLRDIRERVSRQFEALQEDSYESWCGIWEEAESQPTNASVSRQPDRTQAATREASRQVDRSTRGATRSTPLGARRLLYASMVLGLFVVGLPTYAFTLPELHKAYERWRFGPKFVDLNPPSKAWVGKTYRYQVQAVHPQEEPIAFTFIAAPVGMEIDSKTGLIRWTPVQDDARHVFHPVVRIADPKGQNGEMGHDDQRTFQIKVEPPETAGPPAGNIGPFFMAWNPPADAFAGTPYTYAVQAADAENDPLRFALLRAPKGMIIDPVSGTIKWVPTSDQVSTSPHLVTVAVSDPYTGDSTHTVDRNYEVVVKDKLELAPRENRGPMLVHSRPAASAEAGTLYTFQVEASDPDSDPLIFSLPTAPEGMTIDPVTGLIKWTPTDSQIDPIPHVVQVQVTDPHDGDPTHIDRWTYSVRVVPRNTSPFLVNFDPYALAAEGTVYRYTLEANDPEHDPLTFSLLEAPAGMQIDSSSGLILWTPTVGQAAGSPYVVIVQVTDPHSADFTDVDSRSFELTVRAAGMQPPPGNVGPFFVRWSPTLKATESSRYTYTVLAQDGEKDPIVFSMPTAPDGMSINPATGAIAWTPAIGAASGGPYPVTVEVSDPYTADPTHRVSRTFLLTVDPAAP